MNTNRFVDDESGQQQQLHSNDLYINQQDFEQPQQHHHIPLNLPLSPIQNNNNLFTPSSPTQDYPHQQHQHHHHHIFQQQQYLNNSNSSSNSSNINNNSQDQIYIQQQYNSELSNSNNKNPLSFSTAPINRNRKYSDPSIFDINDDDNSSRKMKENTDLITSSDNINQQHQMNTSHSSNSLFDQPFIHPSSASPPSHWRRQSFQENEYLEGQDEEEGEQDGGEDPVDQDEEEEYKYLNNSSNNSKHTLSSSSSNINSSNSNNNIILNSSKNKIRSMSSRSSGDSLIKKNKPKKNEQRNMIGLVSVVLIITQLLGIFMFSQGFFPRKTSVAGYNSFEEYQTSCTEVNVQVAPQFDRVVFMLVDAFRSSFIFGEDEKGTMTFTKSLIESGRAQAFVARADAPTVTLPRVKALLSGGIPSFVDFINNFNSKDLQDDNILYQLRQQNKSMIFFGDDTWLKLFPDYFIRHDGTTSFYVADTVEVDNNVTRHLDELDNNDWDVMFLHYLGLDHIGHLEGPYSDLMAPKQREIDSIVNLIHTKILDIDRQKWLKYKNDTLHNPDSDLQPPLPTLFVFCSDHGMNEIGNHGGSSEGETSAVLILMSSIYYNQNNPDYNNMMENEKHNILERNLNRDRDENDDNNNNNNNDDEGKEQQEQQEQKIEFHPQSRDHDIEITPKFSLNQLKPKEISQVDLVPSLSLLLNLPIPVNSLGRMINDLFEKFIPTEQYLRALEINCQQQIIILKKNTIFWRDNAPATPKIGKLLELFSEAQQYHSSWALSPSHTHFNENAAKLYTEFLRKVQIEFTSLLTTFDNNLLLIGVLLIGSSALVTLLITTSTIGMSELNTPFEIKGASFAMTFVGLVGLILALHFGIICNSLDSAGAATSSINNQFCTNDFRIGVFSFIFTALCLLIGVSAIFSKNNHISKLWTLQSFSPLQLRKEKYVIIVGTILHLISLFGSSLVEEEHLTWYYLTTSVILMQMAPHTLSLVSYFTNTYHQNFKQQSTSSLRQMFILFGILVSLRVFRVWNQTGIKWMDDPSVLEQTYIDFGRFLSTNGFINHCCLWLFSFVSVVAPCVYAFALLDELREQKGGMVSQLVLLYKAVLTVGSVALFSYKWDYIPKTISEPVYVAQFVYLCFFVLMCISFSFPFFSKKDRVVVGLLQPQSWFIVTLRYLPLLVLVNMTLLFLLLHKTHNMFLLTLMGLIGHFYIKYLEEDTGRRSKSGMVGVCVGILCLNWLGQFGYFAFGNSNSLSSIDISGSYTGVVEYNEIVVGLLTFLIGYTAPLFFFFISVSYMSRLAIKSISNAATGNHSNTPQQEPSLHVTNIIYCTSGDIIAELQWYSVIGSLLDCGIRWTNVFVFSVCIIIQKYHLFIWTVFSPKFIYEVLDVSLVLIKALLLAIFIIYLRFLCFIRDKSDHSTSTSQNTNKEE
ncbi:hypothetical protein CYY_005568 [Polysphondylium violaceum]|uniref:GPI ethanolamine phosphate transferase 2 C-terminal domain-containing protein n=1 Tax=Polysphondylium violaceum TaxID=133409 RepID=A0A8J4V416_9MYCE|nr:hypothetical protein CYY_005568 [Polysphondylium violaceum]